MPLKSLLSLQEFGLTAENTLIQYLVPETESFDKQFTPRQVHNTHYTFVRPEKVPAPYYVASSTSCARFIGLLPAELKTPGFIQAFSGNTMLPGLDSPYCTVYGCHCYGQWFGQLGDGRAMGIGEVLASEDNMLCRYELQLKGCGRSPYSRGFDGRAALRSCVREFLVSEAMYHLGVPTTRALSVIGTGLEVRRPWYDTKQGDRSLQEDADNMTPLQQLAAYDNKFSPNVFVREPGAVMCRISRSFLRVSQLELFAKRDETDELVMLADYLCFREFPHLLGLKANQAQLESLRKKGYSDDGLSSRVRHNKAKVVVAADSDCAAAIPPGSPERYVQMYREIIDRNAYLVTEWLRVGYTQGNMNSDNTQLAGRTIDYGPYGWLERFDPRYQPFTSDTDGKFSFMSQPTAMNVNMVVLGQTIEVLMTTIMTRYGIIAESEQQKYIKSIRDLSNYEFQNQFNLHYSAMRQQKLGLSQFEVEDEELWNSLLSLLFRSQADYTLFFRGLSAAVVTLGSIASDQLSAPPLQDAVDIIRGIVYSPLTDALSEEWQIWFLKYSARIKLSRRSACEIQTEMNLANPAYVLRNWMTVLAYERAEQGDNSVIEDLQIVLENPYEEQSVETKRRWHRKTPQWARNMPGSSFLS